MRHPLPVLVSTALAGLVVPLLGVAPAHAESISGCDLYVDDQSPACLAFDTDGDGLLWPDVGASWPSEDGIEAGSTITVTLEGVDLLRPATVTISRHGAGDTGYTPVGTAVVGPGALTASVTVPVGAAGDVVFLADAVDDAAGLDFSDDFEATVHPAGSTSGDSSDDSSDDSSGSSSGATTGGRGRGLVSDLPPGRTVKVGTPAGAVTGSVAGGVRPVVLQARARDGAWVPFAQTTSDADGSFRLPVPTDWVGAHTYRAYAPAHGQLPAADGTGVATVTVERSYAPAGSTAHELLFGKGARWNACTPIRWALNASRMPSWGPAEVRHALGEATAATGLRFQSVGRTSFVPFTGASDGASDEPAGIDLVFAFATPRKVPGLAGSTIGLGGAQVTGRTIHDGAVLLDVSERATRATWRQVVLHELGHALGLAHVRDRHQVMTATATGGNTRYNKGDLVGLASLGAAAGACTGEAPDGLRGTTSSAGRLPSQGLVTRQRVLR